MTPQKKLERIESYGPKLVENITQAISHDILAHTMKTLRNERIVGHVHDEIILEAEKTPASRTSANRWAGHRRGFPGSCCGPTDMNANIIGRTNEKWKQVMGFPIGWTELSA